MKYKLRTNLNNTDWLPNVEDTYPPDLLYLRTGPYEEDLEELFYSKLYESNYSIIGYHCTRLTKFEIENIKNHGLSFGGKELIIKKVSNLPNELNKYKLKLVDLIHQDNSTQADDQICFSYGFLDLDNDPAYDKIFLKNWGGESIYKYYDNPYSKDFSPQEQQEIKEKLRKISIPCIIVLRCPLKVEYNLNFSHISKKFMRYSDDVETLRGAMVITKDVKFEVVEIVDLNKYCGIDFS